MRLNGEGKRLYREERWDLAEEKYRAALATDPDFGGAQLNLACCLARQGRFDKAAEEASALVRHAYVPWAREVVEAADLGILQGRKEEAKIGAARGEASLEWGQRAQSGIFFVARTRPPVRLAGEGLLLLHLNQEIFAWIPETGRYFQLTAEDGHVLALVVSPDGRKIAYILGGKLGRYAGRVPFLRGLFLRVLDIPSMALSTSATIPGDVQ